MKRYIYSIALASVLIIAGISLFFFLRETQEEQRTEFDSAHNNYSSYRVNRAKPAYDTYFPNNSFPYYMQFYAPEIKPETAFKVSVFLKNSSIQTQPNTKDEVFYSLLQNSLTYLLEKEIDLNLATFTPSSLNLDIPLTRTINIWWRGTIPGVIGEENRVGLTYSDRLDFKELSQ